MKEPDRDILPGGSRYSVYHFFTEVAEVVILRLLLPKADSMTDVIAFLDEFKQVRDFKSSFPLLLGDERFRNELFAQIETGRYPYSEYASWIASHFFEAHPSFFVEWAPKFRSVLLTITNHTVQRNLVHIFSRTKVGFEEDGEFLELLIGFIRNPESLPALKVNAFKAIETQYLKAYPELIPELQLLLQLHKEDNRPSIQSLIRYFTKRYSRHLNTASL
jgi:hypothetical protein